MGSKDRPGIAAGWHARTAQYPRPLHHHGRLPAVRAEGRARRRSGGVARSSWFSMAFPTPMRHIVAPEW